MEPEPRPENFPKDTNIYVITTEEPKDEDLPKLFPEEPKDITKIPDTPEERDRLPEEVYNKICEKESKPEATTTPAAPKTTTPAETKGTQPTTAAEATTTAAPTQPTTQAVTTPKRCTIPMVIDVTIVVDENNDVRTTRFHFLFSQLNSNCLFFQDLKEITDKLVEQLKPRTPKFKKPGEQVEEPKDKDKRPVVIVVQDPK